MRHWLPEREQVFLTLWRWRGTLSRGVMLVLKMV